MSVSVVVPIYNERDNVRLLWEGLTKTLTDWGRSYELIFVDDGSRDGTTELLKQLAAEDPRVKLVLFRRNYGQSAAMLAGIQHATLDVVVTMDGDLQNEPADIPMMVEKLDEGFDLVHGWRKQRHDAFLNRRLPSMIANGLISRVTKFPIHDLGCTLKAIRREIAQELELYGEMHRFIPILAARRGARCVEVVTRHHPRRFGQTKYGITRTFRVILDLLTVKFLIQYLASPLKLFGIPAFLCAALTLVAGSMSVLGKLLAGVDLGVNPWWPTAIGAAVATLQCVGLGLLGELGARIYFAMPEKRTYAVRELVNFEQQPTTLRLVRDAA